MVLGRGWENRLCSLDLCRKKVLTRLFKIAEETINSFRPKEQPCRLNFKFDQDTHPGLISL